MAFQNGPDQQACTSLVVHHQHSGCLVELIPFQARGECGATLRKGRHLRDGQDDEPALPSGLTLAPPAPNPSGHGMELRYALPERAQVRLNVYSVSGGLVRTLVRGVRRPGEHVTTWDGRNDRGRRVASGVYFVELLTAGERRTRRAVLLR